MPLHIKDMLGNVFFFSLPTRYLWFDRGSMLFAIECGRKDNPSLRARHTPSLIAIQLKWCVFYGKAWVKKRHFMRCRKGSPVHSRWHCDSKMPGAHRAIRLVFSHFFPCNNNNNNKKKEEKGKHLNTFQGNKSPCDSDCLFNNEKKNKN